jgi:hypothetical protein
MYDDWRILFILLFYYYIELKTKVLVFTVMLVLVASVMVISSQQASALQVRTVFDNRHTSATFGDSKICGDHICAKGEKTKWTHANMQYGVYNV